MRIGIHLPQYGRVAGAEAITRAARHAEELGFADVWVSDHIVHPAAQDYPSPYLYDPLLTLATAAAVTERVGLGTSVLVLPQHNPLWLANALASLDALSGGPAHGGRRRRLVGGASSTRSASRSTTAAAAPTRSSTLLRACWRDDPASFARRPLPRSTTSGCCPKPAHDIPIWIGGGVEAAYRRAVELGDGFQLIGVTPRRGRGTDRAPAGRPARAGRSSISLRTGWDPQGMEHDRIRREHDEYAAAGVQHVVSAPWRTDLDDWLRSMDLLAGLVALD